MNSRHELPTAIIRLRLVQSDVVSAAQCREAGLGRGPLRRMLESGLWQPLARGIYYTQTGEPPWAAFACAGVLMGGEAARLGGLAAATLHRLSDEHEFPIEVLAPARTAVAAPWIHFTRDERAARGESTRSFPPVLNIVDTVLDLAARGSTEDAVAWITSAVQRKLATPQALSRGLANRARLPRRTLIAAVIADAAQGVHSNLERRYFHDVERAHHFPIAGRQVVPAGPTKFLDVTYQEQAVVVELDGRVGHDSTGGAFRDRRRDNAHSLSGWPTLRYGWTDVSGDPCGVAAEVGYLLMARGWAGPVERCRRCPRTPESTV